MAARIRIQVQENKAVLAAMQYEMRFVAPLGGLGAEYAARRRLVC